MLERLTIINQISAVLKEGQSKIQSRVSDIEVEVLEEGYSSTVVFMARELHDANPCPSGTSYIVWVNQYLMYVHSCLGLSILIRMSTNKPNTKSIGQTRLGLIEDSRTTDSR